MDVHHLWRSRVRYGIHTHIGLSHSIITSIQHWNIHILPLLLEFFLLCPWYRQLCQTDCIVERLWRKVEPFSQILPCLSEEILVYRGLFLCLLLWLLYCWLFKFFKWVCWFRWLWFYLFGLLLLFLIWVIWLMTSKLLLDFYYVGEFLYDSYLLPKDDWRHYCLFLAQRLLEVIQCCRRELQDWKDIGKPWRRI